MRSARTVNQSITTVRVESSHPLVAVLAADSELATQRRHCTRLPICPYESLSFVHATGLLPWHGQVPPCPTCHPCPRSIARLVTHLFGLFRYPCIRSVPHCAFKHVGDDLL